MLLLMNVSPILHENAKFEICCLTFIHRFLANTATATLVYVCIVSILFALTTVTHFCFILLMLDMLLATGTKQCSLSNVVHSRIS